MATPEETGKGGGICCGSIIIIYVIIAIIRAIGDSWGSITKNAPGILWGIIFFILLIGICYEGWKAVTPDKRSSKGDTEAAIAIPNNRHTGRANGSTRRGDTEAAIAILNNRLWKGEITPEEYNQLREAIKN